MSLREISGIAGSAMAAQSIRLNTIASNLANADSVATTEAGAYRAKKPVFMSYMINQDGAGVKVADIANSQDPVRKVYEPSNPLADATGYIYRSNVNPVEEMTDMMSASRAFQTNAEVLIRVRSIQQDILRMGDKA